MKVIDIPEFQEPSVGKLENETWTTHYHFILAALGYAVGLGNLWRFPYKMSQHGGMTFLIPYFLVLLFLGIPIFFMELVLGQYVNYGPIKIFRRLAPLFKGLGYSMVAMISCLTVYYNMNNSWSIFYFASAFKVKFHGKTPTKLRNTSSKKCYSLSKTSGIILDQFIWNRPLTRPTGTASRGGISVV